MNWGSSRRTGQLLQRGPGGREPLAVVMGETSLPCANWKPTASRSHLYECPHRHALGQPLECGTGGQSQLRQDRLFNLLTGARQKVANYAVTVRTQGRHAAIAQRA